MFGTGQCKCEAAQGRAAEGCLLRPHIRVFGGRKLIGVASHSSLSSLTTGEDPGVSITEPTEQVQLTADQLAYLDQPFGDGLSRDRVQYEEEIETMDDDTDMT